jgi:hypothetical protein
MICEKEQKRRRVCYLSSDLLKKEKGDKKEENQI